MERFSFAATRQPLALLAMVSAALLSSLLIACDETATAAPASVPATTENAGVTSQQTATLMPERETSRSAPTAASTAAPAAAVLILLLNVQL